MTNLWGNDNGGGGSGANGHRVIVSYTYTQNVAGNYTDVAWQYGLDYGDPNYWNNVRNRSITWSVTTGASISGVAGDGISRSDATTINSSDPGYGGQIHYFWSGTARIVHNGSGAGTIHLAASMRFNNAYDSVIGTDIALPAIPQAPASPSSATASRINDGQVDLAWTNNSTGTAPYANVKVYRRTDGGAWTLIATLGVVTSYSDTTVTTNHKYEYRTSAVGTSGAEVGYATTSAVYTTPSAPSGLTATKLGNGNIRLAWTNNAGYSEHTVRIEESQNGGAFTEITSVASGTATYDHVSPSTSVTHTYRVRARSTTGSLNSAYSGNSNTIILLATANPPTGLAPSGVAKDAADNIVLTWTHNPADGTPQSKYQLQYKVDAGSYTTVGPTTSAASSYILTGGTLTNGHTITWRVATAGENGTLSSYSAESSFTTSAKPTVTISSPSGGTYTTSALTVTWAYFQAQSSAQATWQASLYNAGAVLLETISGTTESSGTFTTPVADATSYTVTVTVTSAAGLAAAAPDSEAFTVTYLPPAAVTIVASFDTGSGAMILALTGAGAVGGVTLAIATVDIERQINGGAWVKVASGLVLDPVTRTIVVLDTRPTVAGVNGYRAVAYSTAPSSGVSSVVNVTTASAWSFLSKGPGFETVTRVQWDGRYDQATDREAALHNFAERELPLAFEGDAVTSKLSVAAVLLGDSSTEAEMHAIARQRGIALWRDPFGRRMFCWLSGMKTSRTNTRRADVSFDLTEIDYEE